MRRAWLVCVGVALALAGCGGGKTASTTSSSSEAPVAVYTVHLAGTSGTPGAPKATGLAVISLYESRESLCWTFSQLEHITTPKKITIRGYVHGTGHFSAPFGPYSEVGCSKGTPKLFFQIVKAHPHDFEVVIATQRPGGPLLGKL